MSVLKNLTKVTGLIAATGLSTYGGIELGDVVKDYVHQSYLLPEMTKGLTAITLGNLGFYGTKKIIGNKYLKKSTAFNLAALNSFANTPNDLRNVTAKQSLEEISNNVVEIIIKNGEQHSVGSGLMITNNGYTLTAQHVIDQIVDYDAEGYIQTQNKEIFPINKEGIFYDYTKDVAIIEPSIFHKKIFRAKPIKAKILEDTKLYEEENVTIMGFKDGQKYVTPGKILQPEYSWRQSETLEISDIFLTDANGMQGQSGGPIVNSEGELIGLIVVGTKDDPNDNILKMGGANIKNVKKEINKLTASMASDLYK